MCINETILAHPVEMRRALGLRYRWFCHVTPLKNVTAIRRRGLEPRSDSAPPDIVRRYMGPNAANIICLCPLGADDVGPPVQDGTRVCLAIERDALPMRLGLDWSFGGTLQRAEDVARDNAGMSPVDVFLAVVHSRGSLVAYDPIPENAIRAFVRGSQPHHILTWPALVAVRGALSAYAR